MTTPTLGSWPTPEQLAAAMDAQDETFFAELGARLAAARKAQAMTQIELAGLLGIPQQTLARYEVGRSRISIDLLLAMSRILGFSIDEMLSSGRMGGRSKRGPVSRLELQLDAVRRLPASKQRFVSDFIDTLLAQQSAS